MRDLRIDFVSDISCPWCAIGLSALEMALTRLQPQVQAFIHCHPFELNPHMGSGGQDITEHLTEKYGSSPAQQAQIRATIRERGADVGFRFNSDGRGRIYNTFNAHRLLHWAGTHHPHQQLALKKALLQACHTNNLAMDDAEVLLQAVAAAGLDVNAARTVLDTEAYADEVRHEEQTYMQLGIRSVPAFIINERYLISGGQPPEAFEQALRSIHEQIANAPVSG